MTTVTAMTPERAAQLQRTVGIATGTFAERLAGTSPAAQALYRAVLPALAATGDPPQLSAAAEQAGLDARGAATALRELATADVVALDADGRVSGVFPLSAVPTRHQVRDADGDGPVLFAMCAVDALGIPAMLGRPGVVTSTDPTTGQTITVHLDHGSIVVDPPGAVVLLARSGDGSLAGSCCSVIDLYAAAGHARHALSQPGMTGEVLTVEEAHALGVVLFAGLPAR